MPLDAIQERLNQGTDAVIFTPIEMLSIACTTAAVPAIMAGAARWSC